MAGKQAVCSSCKRRISNAIGATRFMCQRCAKVEIVRCNHCRHIAAKYRCSECGFEGPN